MSPETSVIVKSNEVNDLLRLLFNNICIDTNTYVTWTNEIVDDLYYFFDFFSKKPLSEFKKTFNVRIYL